MPQRGTVGAGGFVLRVSAWLWRNGRAKQKIQAPQGFGAEHARESDAHRDSLCASAVAECYSALDLQGRERGAILPAKQAASSTIDRTISSGASRHKEPKRRCAAIGGSAREELGDERRPARATVLQGTTSGPSAGSGRSSSRTVRSRTTMWCAMLSSNRGAAAGATAVNPATKSAPLRGQRP